MIELPPDQMRALGYRIVDLLVEHQAGLNERRVTGRSDGATLRARLAQPFPDRGRPLEDILDQLQRDVFANMMHVSHPRFFGFVPGPGNFAGAMADALASGFNVFEGTWLAASGPAALELVTVDWLRRECGLPDTASGLFLSGGSMANLTALAVARKACLNDVIAGATVYFSDQTHSAVERALRVLGFPREQLRKLASGDDFRLPPDRLRDAVAADRAAGLRPFCVVANAGATNTGAVDPLPALAAFCRQEKLWLHGDGAYGAAAAVSERGRRAMAGLELVDSLAVDPHKWLFQPYEIGCAIVREGRLLAETFRITPDYLQDAHRLSGETNFADLGIQLSRQFRALKLWFSLQLFGVAEFRQAVDWTFEQAEIAERRLRASGLWEIVTPAQMAIVSFRWKGEDSETRTAGLVEKMFADGYAMLSSTSLKGRTALRLCTINPRTTAGDVTETISRLEALALA